MKKIISIIIIGILIGCSFSVQGLIYEKNTNKNMKGFSSVNLFRFIFVDGLLRSYQIHIPREYQDDTSAPIVLILHGIPGAARQAKFISKMNGKADEEGFIVVYPNGHINEQYFRSIISPNVWNEWVVHDDIDDGKFLCTLIEKLRMNYNINSSRVHMCGISGGASMTYKFGALYSDVVASIASIAGTIGVIMNRITYMCSDPMGPLPVIIFHGTDDELVPYEGGWCQGLMWKSVNESVTFWVEHNNCNPIPIIKPSETGNTIKETYENGTNGSEVVLFTVVNGGHEWFGSPLYPPCEISATELIWDFFENHPKQ